MKVRLRVGLLLSSLLAVVCSSSDVRAEVISVDADSYIHPSVSGGDANFGTSVQLRIKQDNSPNFHRKAYLRFDLSALSFDHTTDLSTATVNFEFIESGSGALDASGLAATWNFDVYGLNDGNAGEGWGEGTITWNNAPANISTGGGNNFEGTETTLLGSFGVTGKGLGAASFSSAALKTFIEADTDNQITLMFRRADIAVAGSNYTHALASDEHPTAAGPSLDLTQVPEPSSLVILLLSGVGLSFGRRCRKV